MQLLLLHLLFLLRLGCANVDQDQTCWVTGECLGEVYSTNEDINTKNECLDLCQQEEDCQWFTYNPTSKQCQLSTGCPTLSQTCTQCISGESSCNPMEDDYAWHLILGGQGSINPTTAVELYNWQTGEQCQLPDLPYNISALTGRVLDGVPVFCGGFTGLESNPVENRCYKMDKSDKSWIQIADLLAPMYFGASAFVPSEGIIIFGGAGNNLESGQKLATLEGAWEQGPAFYESNADYFHCVVQLNHTSTALLGGHLYPHRILTYDWTTKEYTKNAKGLKGARQFSSCALLNNANGGKLVVIAGGNYEGMEAWNPQDGSVQMLTPDFPPLSMKDAPQLISIDGGAGLIFYQADNEENVQGIWRYFQNTNTWTKVGDMIFARNDFVALPVDGLNCN